MNLLDKIKQNSETFKLQNLLPNIPKSVSTVLNYPNKILKTFNLNPQNKNYKVDPHVNFLEAVGNK